MLEQRCHIGLVTTYPVQRLGQHHIEFATLRVLQQRLYVRPQDHARAGDGGIMVGAGDSLLLLCGALAADAELVVYRGSILVVGRIAGVDCNSGHDDFSSIGPEPVFKGKTVDP